MSSQHSQNDQDDGTSNVDIMEIIASFQKTAEFCETPQHLAVTCPVCYYPIHYKSECDSHFQLHGQFYDPSTHSPDTSAIHMCTYCKLGYLTNREFKAHWNECHPHNAFLSGYKYYSQ